MAPMASLGDKDVTTTIRQVSMIIRDRCILSVLIELCIKTKTVCICIYNYYYNLLRQKEHYNNNVQESVRVYVCVCVREREERRDLCKRESDKVEGGGNGETERTTK